MSFRLPPSEAAKLDALTPRIGQGMAAAAAAREDWLPADTERWLTDFPLPATFIWNGTRAYPRYTLKKGYGFWLKVAGQHYPALRGLFVLCHDVLSSLRPGIDPMPGPDQLAAILLARQKPPAELPWSDEDRRIIAPGVPHPGENAPSHAEPTENPHDTQEEPDEAPY